MVASGDASPPAQTAFEKTLGRFDFALLRLLHDNLRDDQDAVEGCGYSKVDPRKRILVETSENGLVGLGLIRKRSDFIDFRQARERSSVHVFKNWVLSPLHSVQFGVFDFATCLHLANAAASFSRVGAAPPAAKALNWASPVQPSKSIL